jgi:hypothetical protein
MGSPLLLFSVSKHFFDIGHRSLEIVALILQLAFGWTLADASAAACRRPDEREAVGFDVVRG